MIIFKDELKEILHSKSPTYQKSENGFKTELNQAPKPKAISFSKGALIYLTLSCIGMLVSTTIATYVFFGAITLAGLIAIAESNKYIRYVIIKGSRLLDLGIFALTIFATISLGVTLTASLTFAGLGYTLIYAPYLRSRDK